MVKYSLYITFIVILLGLFRNVNGISIEENKIAAEPEKPSLMPTNAPTRPTQLPTLKPSEKPSQHPSIFPSHQPSINPTYAPSFYPSVHPSPKPSLHPTLSPSHHPSVKPSLKPSQHPTVKPSKSPSAHPTTHSPTRPTIAPTKSPADVTTNNYGVDVSALLTSTEMSCLVGSNILFLIARGYHSSGSVDTNICKNLETAYSVKMKYRDTYLVPCKDFLFFYFLYYC
jgi:hypothetical protein